MFVSEGAVTQGGRTPGSAQTPAASPWLALLPLAAQPTLVHRKPLPPHLAPSSAHTPVPPSLTCYATGLRRQCHRRWHRRAQTRCWACRRGGPHLCPGRTLSWQAVRARAAPLGHTRAQAGSISLSVAGCAPCSSTERSSLESHPGLPSDAPTQATNTASTCRNQLPAPPAFCPMIPLVRSFCSYNHKSLKGGCHSSAVQAAMNENWGYDRYESQALGEGKAGELQGKAGELQCDSGNGRATDACKRLDTNNSMWNKTGRAEAGVSDRKEKTTGSRK